MEKSFGGSREMCTFASAFALNGGKQLKKEFFDRFT